MKRCVLAILAAGAIALGSGPLWAGEGQRDGNSRSGGDVRLAGRVGIDIHGHGGHHGYYAPHGYHGYHDYYYHRPPVIIHHYAPPPPPPVYHYYYPAYPQGMYYHGPDFGFSIGF
jgi:hypothetical protein